MIRPSILRHGLPAESEPRRAEIQIQETGGTIGWPDTVEKLQSISPRPSAMPSSDNFSGSLIDRAGSLSRMGDDLELLQDMAAMFIRDVPSLLSTLRDALAAGDAEEAARAAHSIKGLASNFGAAPCVAAAAAIENPAKSGQLADLTGQQTRLAEQVELLCGALRREVLQ